MTLELVPVSSITINPKLQMREVVLDEPHVDALERAISDDGELLHRYPIALAEIDKTLIVVDGHHRLTAAIRLKLPTVPAKIVASSWHDALSHAARSNNHEGSAMKRTATDRRKALMTLLENVEFRNMTDSALAEIVGVAISTAGQIRKLKSEYQSDSRITRTGKVISAAAVGVKPTRPAVTINTKPAADATYESKPLTTPSVATVEATDDPGLVFNPKASDQAVILRLQEEVGLFSLESTHYQSLIKNLWNLALERRPDLFKVDEQLEPEDILKRVLETPEPLNGAPSKAAAEVLASCLKGTPFSSGKPISDVTRNARKVLPKDEIAWLKAELTTRRQCQTVVLESAE